ncbi:MAG: hypothetical protein IJ561_05460 [Ruminococcus sp.]|nr:hypothetical protein [Ruminococcus sp.]
MTNLFGLNVTDNKENTVLDGEVFCTDRISSGQEAEIGSFLEEEMKLEKQGSLPTFLSVIKGICLFVWVITLIGTLNALADGTSLSQGHKNAPVLDWVGIICFAVWLVLQIVSVLRRKKTKATPEYQQSSENGENLLQSIRETLGIPDDAQKIDVLAERYVMKDGKPKRKAVGLTEFDNIPMFTYIKDGRLCLADTSSVWEIPLSSLRSMELIKKRASFPDWTKPEPYDSKTYKPYKITTNQFGYFAKYYRVEIRDLRGDFYLLIPEYDGMTFSDIAKLRIEE